MKACFWISIFCFLGSAITFSEDKDAGLGYLIFGIIFFIITSLIYLKYKKHPELLEQKKELKAKKQVEKLKLKEAKQQELKEKVMQKMVCPRCQSTNTNVQIISEQKSSGCLGVLFYIILAVTLIGIPIMLIILLSKGKKTVTHKECVCQDCGKSWRIYG